VDTTETVESLRQRLNQCEQALQRCERLAVAGRYAGAVMHEVNNPLAAITNLVFLTKLQADNRAKVLENMDVVETQLVTLGKVTRQVLAFHREQGEATESDLIEIVESALTEKGFSRSRHSERVWERHSSGNLESHIECSRGAAFRETPTLHSGPGQTQRHPYNCF
jgi:C4-dicarboxylate-specific signal transduction histidine kinase